MRLLNIIYFIVMGAGFLVSLSSFRRRHVPHLRILSIGLGAMLVGELYAYFMFMKSGRSVLYVYNVFALFQMCMFSEYYRRLIKLGTVRFALGVFLVLYPVIWFLSVYEFGINQFHTYPLVLGQVFLVFVSVAYYYQLITAPNPVALQRHPEFWIATGIILCYGCHAPFTASFQFVSRNYFEGTRVLVHIIQMLAIAMYSIFLYAYICSLWRKLL